MSYIGRFAPTPSGNLHMGSLLCAVISYLDAKSHQGQWLLRVDDVDTPRVVKGASDAILRTLEQHGLLWDGAVCYQSQQFEHYQAALEQLVEQGDAFYCGLTRKVLYAQFNGLHPGRAQRLDTNDPANMAMRLDVQEACIGIDDRWAGRYEQQLSKTVGALVLKRRDGIFSYHLACAVDDYRTGVTHVVRGMDLLAQTPAQCYLQTLLGYPRPHYAHHFLLYNPQGQKLSKQHHAQAVDATPASENLRTVLNALGLQPPAFEDCGELLTWALAHWSSVDMVALSAQDAGH